MPYGGIKETLKDPSMPYGGIKEILRLPLLKGDLFCDTILKNKRMIFGRGIPIQSDTPKPVKTAADLIRHRRKYDT